MPTTLHCPHCGQAYTCNPEGDCWCKAHPPVTIPDALKSDRCLCRCQLDRLRAGQSTKTGSKTGPKSGPGESPDH